MKRYIEKYVICLTLALASLSTVFARTSSRAHQQTNWDEPKQFQVRSKTFRNGAQVPLTMVLGVQNPCPYISGGGDQSPDLSWENAPQGTRSFVVTLFDTTAAFTHWGMYNISPDTTGLPAGAGVAGSQYGQQVENDFYYGEQYDGPCPPNDFTPYLHHYVLTVYALDTSLSLPSYPPNFPADGETLYRAMFSHVLQSASIEGYLSSVN